MAKLNSIYNSDEEFPDIDIILRPSGRVVPRTPRKGAEKEYGKRLIPRSESSKRTVKKKLAAQEDGGDVPKSTTKVSCIEKQVSRQRPIRTIPINSLSLLKTNEPHAKTKHSKSSTTSKNLDDISQARPSKRRTARKPMNYKISIPKSSSTSGSEEESYDDGLSDFVADDSASELEIAPPTSPERIAPPAERFRRVIIDDSTNDDEMLPLQKPNEDLLKDSRSSLLEDKPHLPFPKRSSSGRKSQPEIFDLTSPVKAVPTIIYSNSMSTHQSMPISFEPSTNQTQDPAPAILQ